MSTGPLDAPRRETRGMLDEFSLDAPRRETRRMFAIKLGMVIKACIIEI